MIQVIVHLEAQKVASVVATISTLTREHTLRAHELKRARPPDERGPCARNRCRMRAHPSRSAHYTLKRNSTTSPSAMT